MNNEIDEKMQLKENREKRDQLSKSIISKASKQIWSNEKIADNTIVQEFLTEVKKTYDI